MNYIALFIGTSLTLAACCPTIPLMDPCDNSLTLQLQKTDSPNCGEPDGQITFIHPQPGAQVSYK